MGGLPPRSEHSGRHWSRLPIAMAAHRENGQFFGCPNKLQVSTARNLQFKVLYFCCRKLSLSSNMIEKIAGISTLKNLRILSLGRNYIKNFAGLVRHCHHCLQSQPLVFLSQEALSETLEELWISYNYIERIKGVTVLKKLKVLYMSNNLVKEWSEFNKLQDLPCLEDLLFVGKHFILNVCKKVLWRPN